jgi:hypothetical protein
MPRRTTHFQGLNECADPEFAYARSFVEEWFQRLPDGEKRDLHARLSSKDDGQHQQALFQLYLHELLVKMRYDVQCHPEVSREVRGRPDFLALRDGGPLFYLEATTTAPAVAQTNEEKRLDAVYDALDEIACPNFWLDVVDHGGLKTAPKLHPLCRRVERWAATFPPDEVSARDRRGEETTLLWEENGWLVEITLIPKPPELRGVPGTRPIGAQVSPGRFVVPEEGILHAMRTKANTYGEPGLPLVMPSTCWMTVGAVLTPGRRCSARGVVHATAMSAQP